MTSGPLLTSAFDGLPHEHDFKPLQVDGILPADLAGTLYRNGPAVFDVGTDPHWFDGTSAPAPPVVVEHSHDLGPPRIGSMKPKCRLAASSAPTWACTRVDEVTEFDREGGIASVEDAIVQNACPPWIKAVEA